MSDRYRLYLLLILILALALRWPGWFTQDEKTRFRIFEPDEFQHVEVAVHQLQSMDEALLPEWKADREIFNARGYGIQLGVVAWLGHRFFGLSLAPDTLVIIGRVLSTVYALLTVCLVFLLSVQLFANIRAALLAALLMSVFDLHVTYSHYAVPEAMYVFWSYGFLYSWYIFLIRCGAKIRSAKSAIYLALAALAAAAAFAGKYDFIPVAVAVASTVFLMVRGELKSGYALLIALLFSGAFLLGFLLINCFNVTPQQLYHSFWELYRQNKDVIPVDQHYLYNPFLYGIAVMAGTSLIVFILAGWGFIRLIRAPATRSAAFWLIVFFLLLELGVLWNLDTPFVRRALIFLPAIALGAAYSWTQLPDRKWKITTGILAVIYTLALTLISQSNAWWDTRYRARTYLQEQHGDKRIKYGGYAFAAGMPAGVPLRTDEEILVLHEAEYSRYWRSFTTPFRIPRCCEEVYHCQEEHCRKIQQLLADTHSDYRLLRRFATRQWLPERVLFKHYLGNYETFLGDLLIFEKIRQ